MNGRDFYTSTLPVEIRGKLTWSLRELRSVLDDRVGAQEMIPFALRANLDVVGREVALASPDSLEVSIGHHASTSSGKPRSKDVLHFYDVCVVADRAFHVSRASTLTRVAHQL